MRTSFRAGRVDPRSVREPPGVAQVGRPARRRSDTFAWPRWRDRASHPADRRGKADLCRRCGSGAQHHGMRLSTRSSGCGAGYDGFDGVTSTRGETPPGGRCVSCRVYRRHASHWSTATTIHHSTAPEANDQGLGAFSPWPFGDAAEEVDRSSRIHQRTAEEPVPDGRLNIPYDHLGYCLSASRTSAASATLYGHIERRTSDRIAAEGSVSPATRVSRVAHAAGRAAFICGAEPVPRTGLTKVAMRHRPGPPGQRPDDRHRT
jgi:hypothetical protein